MFNYFYFENNGGVASKSRLVMEIKKSAVRLHQRIYSFRHFNRMFFCCFEFDAS